MDGLNLSRARRSLCQRRSLFSLLGLLNSINSLIQTLDNSSCNLTSQCTSRITEHIDSDSSALYWLLLNIRHFGEVLDALPNEFWHPTEPLQKEMLYGALSATYKLNIVGMTPLWYMASSEQGRKIFQKLDPSFWSPNSECNQNALRTALCAMSNEEPERLSAVYWGLCDHELCHAILEKLFPGFWSPKTKGSA